MVDHNFTRGGLESLSIHPCADNDSSTNSSTSDCCKFDISSQQCGVYFFGKYQHPCALCSQEELPIPTQKLCNYCAESYPNASMGEVAVLHNNTIVIDQLVDHQCAINNDGDMSNCCLYDATNDQCGIFMNDMFVTPCGRCAVPSGTREISDTLLHGLIGGSIALVMVLIISYCWNRCHYKNAKSRTIVMKREEPTAVPVGEEQVIYAEVFPLENESDSSTLPVPIPVPVLS